MAALDSADRTVRPSRLGACDVQDLSSQVARGRQCARGRIRIRRPGSHIHVRATTLPSRPIIRARLQARLTYGVREKSLVLVSAPAGSGKTVLAASWAEAHDISWPVAWLTVHDACERSEVFWSYVAETIVRSGVNLRHANRPPPGRWFLTPFSYG